MRWRRSFVRGILIFVLSCFAVPPGGPSVAFAQCPTATNLFIPQIINNCAAVHFSWGYTIPNVTYQIEGKTGANSFAAKGPATTALAVDVPMSQLTPRGAYWTFRVKATLAGCPTIYSPEYPGFWVPPAPTDPTGVSAQSLAGGQIKIIWSPSGSGNSTAVLYKNGSATSFANANWSDGQYTYTEPNCGNFYFQVQAQSNGGCLSGKVSTLAVTRSPNFPTLTAPADNASLVSGDVTFSWAAASCAATYTLQVDTENTFTAPLAFSATTATTSAVWPAAPTGTYYWRVQACNGSVCSNSATRLLTITSVPVPLVLLSPVGGENWPPGSQQTVTWSGGGTVRVDLFADATVSGASLVGPSVTLNAAATGGSVVVTLPSDIATTRARIQLSRTTGTPTYSYSPSTFRIVTPPPAGTWSYAAVDAPNNGWNQSDMCLNATGGVSAVYFDYLGGPDEDLRYASRIDKTWAWEPTIAQSAGKVGSWPSIARGSDGRLHVAYYDHTVGAAKLYYTSFDGTSWSSPELVAPIQVVQGDCSIALDQAGIPLIAFNTGNQDGSPNWMKLRVYKRQANGTWAQFGATIDAVNPHHITLKGNYTGRFYLAYIDQGGARMNIWIYNTAAWVQYTSQYITFAPGPYTDASLALDTFGYPQLAYTAAGTGSGQKLVFQPWGANGTGFDPAITLDSSLGTIASVSLQYGGTYPRVGYVGNGIVKLVTGVYSPTQWPVAWTAPEIVDATGDMDSQLSLVVNPATDERWFLYRDLGTASMRSAGPYYVDASPPPAVTDLGFATGLTTGVLWWTAPDDGNGNQAVAYDLRSSFSPITEGNFYAALAWPVNSPQAPGSAECLDLSLQSCSAYYWAIKTRDAFGNWSAASNCPGRSTRCSGSLEVTCALAPQGPPSDATDLPDLPAVLAIGQVAPNPATAPVIINLAIPAALAGAELEMKIFDVTGRLVRLIGAGPAEPGVRSLGWDLRNARGEEARNGVYFARIRVGDRVENRRVLVAR